MNLDERRRYKESKQKLEELNKLLLDLDIVGAILYNNLEYDDIWNLIQKYEDVRIKYYVDHYEHEIIVENKGQIDVKK